MRFRHWLYRLCARQHRIGQLASVLMIVFVVLGLSWALPSPSSVCCLTFDFESPETSHFAYVGLYFERNELWVSPAESLLYRPGDDASALNDHLLEHTSVQFKGRTLIRTNAMSLLSLMFAYDEVGEMIASYSDITLYYALNISELAQEGRYPVTLTTQTTTGEVFTEVWSIVASRRKMIMG